MSENSDKNYQSELTDQTVINNIDLGGILNLATEDTNNIRLSILIVKTYRALEQHCVFYNFNRFQNRIWKC